MTANRQNGFIIPSLNLYFLLGAGVIILALGVALKVQSLRLESCKAEFQTFKSEVNRLGIEAKAKALLIEAQDKFKKEQADESLRKLRIANGELSKRLRDNAGRSFVSSGETPAGKPDLACYESASLNDAIRNFATGVSGIIEQGQGAVTDLNNAKSWARP